jgi:hypothetical protein
MLQINPRALMIGFGLSVMGIALFLLLWFALPIESQATRLFLAMCLPPAVIALLVGGYALRQAGKAKQ